MHPPRQRERGSALFVTMMMLILMTGMAMAALDTVTRDQQVAGFQNRVTSSFYAAEAGASEARNLVRGVGDRSETPAFHPPASPATLGDSGIYQYGLPTYYGDPTVLPAPPIRYVADGAPYSNGGNLQMKGQRFVETRWQINVVGTTAAGASSRIEVMATKILSRGY
jgi:hypothetical protein